MSELRNKYERQSPAEGAYLIRCWQEGPHWRFSAEKIERRRRRIGFAALEELFAWLRDELGGNAW